jgi:hypothetical protein
MEEKKFNVTYPIVGWVTLQVTAKNEERAKEAFLAKADELKLKGAVLEEEHSEYSWEFMDDLITGNVFHGEVSSVSVEEVENSSVIDCPYCLGITSEKEVQMLGGMCKACLDYPF